MPDRIAIERLAVETVVGVFDWERRVKQSLQLDVVLHCDLRLAGATDHLADTVDYKSLTKRLRTHLQGSRYQLVETLAADAVEICLEAPAVHAAAVTVHKPGALRHADSVSVRIERKRGDPTGRPPHVAYLGVGSNIEPTKNVRDGLARLHEQFGAIRVSPAYRTTAVGAASAPDFINLVVGIRTSLEPQALVDWLHSLEAEAGRVRTDDPNISRTLDLDLLLYDSMARKAAPTLPHPQVTGSPFVLVPLADLIPDRVVPGTPRTVAEFRAELPADVPGVELFDEEVLY